MRRRVNRRRWAIKNHCMFWGETTPEERRRLREFLEWGKAMDKEAYRMYRVERAWCIRNEKQSV